MPEGQTWPAISSDQRLVFKNLHFKGAPQLGPGPPFPLSLPSYLPWPLKALSLRPWSSWSQFPRSSSRFLWPRDVGRQERQPGEHKRPDAPASQPAGSGPLVHGPSCRRPDPPSLPWASAQPSHARPAPGPSCSHQWDFSEKTQTQSGYVLLDVTTDLPQLLVWPSRAPTMQALPSSPTSCLCTPTSLSLS